MAAWPSGKAEDCKSFTPSSNLGAAFKFLCPKDPDCHEISRLSGFFHEKGAPKKFGDRAGNLGQDLGQVLGQVHKGRLGPSWVRQNSLKGPLVDTFINPMVIGAVVNRQTVAHLLGRQGIR
jgi:hypothetical protein